MTYGWGRNPGGRVDHFVVEEKTLCVRLDRDYTITGELRAEPRDPCPRCQTLADRVKLVPHSVISGGDRVFIVEHREWVASCVPDVMDTVVMATFTTKIAAERWLAEVGDEGGWYALFEDEVDTKPGDHLRTKLIGFYGPTGQPIEEQPERRNHTRMLCEECGEPTELFMMNRDLWLSLKYKENNVSCMKCVSKRLGRKLRLDDMSKALVNRGWMEHFER